MVSEFTVFGSCTCRDIFNSTLNIHYKDFFHIGKTGIRMSFISIMQEPVEYSDESVIIYPQKGKNINFTIWIKDDFDKWFLDVLKEENFEYLLIDTYYDTNFGVVEIGDGRFVTNNIRLDETEFYRNLDYKRVLTIMDDTEEYFNLWKKSCNLFFKFLEENCPNLVVILNPTRHVDKLLTKEGYIVEDESFKEECNKYNHYRDLFDEYIIKNFDVEVLKFDETTVSVENHLWGCSSLHYGPSYFVDINNQLNEIIKRNESIISEEDKLINKEVRIKNRDELLDIINKRKSQKLREKRTNVLSKVLNKVSN
ncbi:MAG: hypothetical protein IKV87_01070 [Methanobrevibacter sp.]|nr:hypothetical protein [Methanobrevibacter sp.]